MLALDCSAIPGFEFTALNMLVNAEEQLRRDGVDLWLVSLNPEALEMIRRTPLAGRLGDSRMRFNLEETVDAYSAHSA